MEGEQQGLSKAHWHVYLCFGGTVCTTWLWLFPIVFFAISSPITAAVTQKKLEPAQQMQGFHPHRRQPLVLQAWL